MIKSKAPSSTYNDLRLRYQNRTDEQHCVPTYNPKETYPFHTLAESRRANKLKYVSEGSILLAFWERDALKMWRVEIWDMIRSRTAKDVWLDCCGNVFGIWPCTEMVRCVEAIEWQHMANYFIHAPCQKCRQANSIPNVFTLASSQRYCGVGCILQFRSWPQDSTKGGIIHSRYSAKSMIKG